MSPGKPTDVPRIPMQVVNGSVVASIQMELTGEVLHVFQQDILNLLRRTRARAVILDLAGVEILDAQDFDSIRRTLAMAGLMGAVPVIVGLRPGIAASLAELDASAEGIVSCLTLDRAFALVARSAS